MPEPAPSREDLSLALRDSTEQVLSTMFFAEILDELSPEVVTAEPLVHARLSFSGPLSGTLHVALSETAASVLATDFFGQETVDVGPVHSVIGELANIICGSTLSRIEPGALFSLSHPEPAAELFTSGDVTLCFALADGPLAVSVQIN